MQTLSVWPATLLKALLGCLLCLNFSGVQAQIFVSAHHLQPSGQTQAASKSLKEALDELKNQFGVHFMYDNDVPYEQMVSFKISGNENLDKSLSRLLRPLELKYQKIQHNVYIIISKDAPIKSIPAPAIKTGSINGKTNSQSSDIHSIVNSLNAASLQRAGVAITGRVTDEKEEPLPGVNVLLKGTTNGTVTDANGRYTLSVPEGSSSTILVFSFIGYLTEEIGINGRTEVNIALTPDIKSLEEVVVVGYGEVKKRDITGSVATISPKDFEKQPIVRVEDALQGRTAGVMIQRSNGAPGAGAKIRIRGASTITGSSQPLVVIDGFIGGDLSSINPNDIQSIEVLKDASAAAIYGSRATNGVILITTKQAKAGTPRVDFDAFYTFERIPKKFDLLSGAEYMETINAKNDALKQGRTFSDEQIAEVRQQGGTDWQDEILRTGHTQNYQLSLAGGTDAARFFISGNYANQEGIILNTGYKRYTVRANMDSKVTKRLDVGIKLYGTREEGRNVRDFNGGGNVLGAALGWAPNLPVYDPVTGDYTRVASYGSVFQNPVFQALEQNRDEVTNGFLGNVSLSYTILEGLKFTVSGNANLRNQTINNFNRYVPGNKPESSNGSSNDNQFITWMNTNQLSYEKRLGRHHQVSAVVAYEQYVASTTFNTSSSTGFTSISLGSYGLELGATPRVTSGFTKRSMESYIGRLNYTFQDKYLLTGTFRMDGTSIFRPQNRYVPVYAGALAWRISEEPFMRSVPFVNDLKFRTSYGITVNQAIDPYQTLQQMAIATASLGEANVVPSIGPGTPANPGLQWEPTTQADAGLDLSVLGGRLNLTADVYQRTVNNLLLSVDYPTYTGVNSVIQNVGSLQNRGFELILGGTPINRGDFQLTANFNLSRNQTKILDLGGKDERFSRGNYNFSEMKGNVFRLAVGEEMGQLMGLVYEGVWKSDEADQARAFKAVPGDARYRDVNGDNVINGNDLVVVGNALPKFTYGFNVTATYKNFDLNLFMQGVYGNKIYNFSRYAMIGMGANVKDITATDIRRRWTPENENTDIPNFNRIENQSTFFLENGSFARLKNVSLGYSLPQSVLGRVGLQSVRVYVSGQNLLTFTKYTGYDPEVSSTPNGTNGDFFQGVDNGAYPNSKIFTAGLRVGF
jgi:TonB-dependent starch-binding outer membrane protein SusC